MNSFDKLVTSILKEQSEPDIFGEPSFIPYQSNANGKLGTPRNWEVTSKIPGADSGRSGTTNMPRADSRIREPLKLDWDEIDYVWNWLGMVPFYGAGSVFDITHAISYWAHNHPILAVITAICAIPGAGDALGLFKLTGGGKAIIRQAAASGWLDKIVANLVKNKGEIIARLEKEFVKQPATKKFFEEHMKNQLEPIFNKLAQYASKPIQSHMGQGAATLAVDVPLSLGIGAAAGGVANKVHNMPSADTTNNASPWVEPKPYSYSK